MLAPRTVVVVNPNSQGGKLGKRWREVAETLGRAFPFDEVRTTGPGDATRLTREALKQGAERIVAIGGDGTVNEVVNGFFEDGVPVAPEASFALIPFGTGGDFRRTLMLPTDIADAADVIAANRRKKIDVGKLSFVASDGTKATRMFANIASFGVSGVVDRLVNESGKRLGGRLSFMLATARATLSYKNQRVQLVLDGKDRVEATINTVAVANGRYFGGGMLMAPSAELDDGAFDVICVGDLGLGELLVSGRKLYAGTHLSMEKVSARRARVVEAEPIDPGSVVELDVDGEAPGRLPARFELLPSALWVVTPTA
ncbi:MAG TPA: diacylglycerol kinase family protein [Kofleriaceae bacterium]|jgi:YegS/Rv2252/BmrU family lipid kinase|nr:diacylglycerol kinase family protein [Kofleriaceae bacterium]